MKMNQKTKGVHPALEVELLTTKEAAALLRLSESFLAKARMRGDGPRYRKLSRSVRYDKADVLLWLKASAKTSTAECDRPHRSEKTAQPNESRTSGKDGE
jgi:predicted DNA-binding transcriptional regulator AlpA